MAEMINAFRSASSIHHKKVLVFVLKKVSITSLIISRYIIVSYIIVFCDLVYLINFILFD